MSHNDKDYLNMIIIVNHAKSWSTLVNHGEPCFKKSNIVIHGQSWSTMIEGRIVINIVLI